MNPEDILPEIRHTRDGFARESGCDLKRLFAFVRAGEREPETAALLREEAEPKGP